MNPPRVKWIDARRFCSPRIEHRQCRHSLPGSGQAGVDGKGKGTGSAACRPMVRSSSVNCRLSAPQNPPNRAADPRPVSPPSRFNNGPSRSSHISNRADGTVLPEVNVSPTSRTTGRPLTRCIATGRVRRVSSRYSAAPRSLWEGCAVCPTRPARLRSSPMASSCRPSECPCSTQALPTRTRCAAFGSTPDYPLFRIPSASIWSCRPKVGPSGQLTKRKKLYASVVLLTDIAPHPRRFLPSMPGQQWTNLHPWPNPHASITKLASTGTATTRAPVSGLLQ